MPEDSSGAHYTMSVGNYCKIVLKFVSYVLYARAKVDSLCLIVSQV